MLYVGDIVVSGDRLAPVQVGQWIKKRSAGCVVGNCEISFTQRGRKAAKFVAWRTDPRAAFNLRALGFDQVSVANNHAVDYGWEGLRDTLSACREAGLVPFGGGETLNDASAPAVADKGRDVHVATIAVACTLPLGAAARTDQPGINPIRVSTRYEFDPLDLQEEPGCQPTIIHTVPNEQDIARVCKQIESLRDEGFRVVLYIHWGNAFQKQLAQYQRTLAVAFADAGCDMIIGHHPHTIHGLEMIGSMPVFYSLGNFIMDTQIVHRADEGLPTDLATPWIMSKEGLAVVAKFGCNGLIQVQAIPICTDADGYPTALNREEANLVLHQVESYPPGKPPWQIDNGLGVIHLP